MLQRYDSTEQQLKDEDKDMKAQSAYLQQNINLEHKLQSVATEIFCKTGMRISRIQPDYKRYSISIYHRVQNSYQDSRSRHKICIHYDSSEDYEDQIYADIFHTKKHEHFEFIYTSDAIEYLKKKQSIPKRYFVNQNISDEYLKQFILDQAKHPSYCCYNYKDSNTFDSGEALALLIDPSTVKVSPLNIDYYFLTRLSQTFNTRPRCVYTKGQEQYAIYFQNPTDEKALNQDIESYTQPGFIQDVIINLLRQTSTLALNEDPEFYKHKTLRYVEEAITSVKANAQGMENSRDKYVDYALSKLDRLASVIRSNEHNTSDQPIPLETAIDKLDQTHMEEYVLDEENAIHFRRQLVCAYIAIEGYAKHYKHARSGFWYFIGLPFRRRWLTDEKYDLMDRLTTFTQNSLSRLSKQSITTNQQIKKEFCQLEAEVVALQNRNSKKVQNHWYSSFGKDHFDEACTYMLAHLYITYHAIKEKLKKHEIDTLMPTATTKMKMA